MRLHRLELQAFGPYARPQRIDFDRLAGGGLFLLEGPTGAGKTTILDAITFALYGGLAGQDGGDDRLHSDFADSDIEPLVELEFSVNGVRYQVTRVPEHERRKRRGSGFTVEPMRVHLQRRQDGHWVSLSANKAEVGDAITTAVGLNRAQFTQVMLLPQGEFARFLRSDDDAKRTLLTKLFGTELYDKVTAELDRRRAQAVRDRQQAGAAVATAVSAAAEAAGLDAGQRHELIEAGAADRRIRFKQIGDEIAALAAISSSALELATDQLAKAVATELAASRQADSLARLAQASMRLRAHEATRREHELQAAELSAARRAEPVRPLLTALTEAEREVSAARLRVRACSVDDGQRALGGDSVDSAAARKSARRAATRADEAARTVTSLEPLVSAEARVSTKASRAASLAEVAAAAVAEVAVIEAARAELPDLIAHAEAELEAARSTAGGVEIARQQLSELDRIGVAARRLAELAPKLACVSDELRTAVDVHQRLVDEHQQAMDDRLAGIAAELASGLSAGQSCPVCGSTEHPEPARPGTESVTPEAVALARGRRDEAERARSELASKHADLDHEIAGLTAIAADNDPAELAARTVIVAGCLTAAQQASARADRLESDLVRRRAEQGQLADRLVAAVTARSAAVADAERADTELAELAKALADAAAPYPSVAARKQALDTAIAADLALAAALAGLATVLDEAERARVRAQDEALTSGFGSTDREQDIGLLPLDLGDGAQALESARAAVRSPHQQAKLDGRVAGWLAALAELRAAIGAPDLVGLDPGLADQARLAAEQAGAVLTTATQAEREARAALTEQQARAKRLADRLAEVHAAEAAAEELTTATAPVIYLAGLAKGMDGQRRVALTTYVLRHWFEQVVAAANVRLAAMSAGRYELRRSDAAGSRRQRTGLTLSVIDRYTGEERSPKSLSGGETFYTSLALALGLADVVKAEAGGVDLQTLFIDEGFGSLDEDTLDQVLGVIDELRDRGRAVGIVSHVAELKGRVTERLEVRRLPDGSSVAKVVA